MVDFKETRCKSVWLRLNSLCIRIHEAVYETMGLSVMISWSR